MALGMGEFQTLNNKTLSELYLRLKTIDAKFGPVSQIYMSNAANAAKRSMHKEKPVGLPKRTGTLRRSIRFSDKYMPGGAGGGGTYEKTISIGEGVPYFKYVVFGVKPHTRTRQARSGNTEFTKPGYYRAARLTKDLFDEKGRYIPPTADSSSGMFYPKGKSFYSNRGATIYETYTHKGQAPQIEWALYARKAAEKSLQKDLEAYKRAIFSNV